MEAAKRSIEDPNYADKLYHVFEMDLDAEGNRRFSKANSGLVFESFQLLDPTLAPVLVIVASDSAHHGNVSQHPLYCEYDGNY